MKYLKPLVILAFAAALIGCENPELVQCQEDNQQLQTELESTSQAREAAQGETAELEQKLDEQKEKSKEMQNKAMESITKMLTKQAEKEEKIKQSLKDAKAQLKETTNKLSELAEENERLRIRIAELENTIQQAQQETEQTDQP
jgi:septal ring factor EnvC (AmiA/AmiB activator)